MLQRRVRDSRAGYIQSMDVLRAAKSCGVYTKSSIMLGLGETDDEIIDTMLDLKASTCLAYDLFLQSGMGCRHRRADQGEPATHVLA